MQSYSLNIQKLIVLIHNFAMLKKITSLNSLRTFTVAARCLSFTKAATELHVTQAAVSYQIRQLETQLGVKLFHRSIRKISLTDGGERLHKVTRSALRSIDAELQQLIPTQETTRLTIGVSTYVTVRWLSSRLNLYLDTHPDISLQLLHDINEKDFDIGQYDLAIRWGKAPWRNVASQELLPMPMMPVCTHSFLQANGGLKSPQDLKGVTLLRDSEDIDLWPIWLEKAGVDPSSVGHGRIITDPIVRIQAAIDGQGIVLGDGLLVDEITHGHLIVPFDINLEGYGYHLLWDHHTALRKISEEFRHWLLT
jgi:DNA-binding transcriptional LysR family regulator